ncbi:MAG: hypothetical protein NZ740_10125 [Kiritimatiellae bacterium]|nr:hypothetical protein [Kiritimatiellia bacterium]MDW8459449.1 DUF6798 domain-containing protein [Verrucomicrobiota bacterium]
MLIRWAAIFCLLCLLHLFRDNVEGNELHKFIEAVATRNPNWLPGAYAEKPDSSLRHLIFYASFVPLLERDHFLAASIVGRVAAYALLAGGLAYVTRRMGLATGWALGVVYAMYVIRSMAAGEWIIGGVEPKVFAYGIVFFVMGLLTLEHLPWLRIAMLLAAATLVHVLVGLYATFSSLAVWLAMVWQRTGTARRIPWNVILVGGFVGLAFVGPAFEHFSSDWDREDARIYVTLRSPHHLDPSHWPLAAWLRLAGFSALFALAWLIAARRSPTAASAHRLGVFCAASFIPLVIGLLASPFPIRWYVLPYYPFRFADVMIPFGVLMLGALALQHSISPRWSKAAQVGIVAALSILVVPFCRDALALRRFPVDPYSGVTEDWYACMKWIRSNTPPDALFVVPPIASESFPWLARRRALAVFKHTSLSGGLKEWERRMSDLAGWQGPWPARGWDAARLIAERYDRRTTPEAEALMAKYGAGYWIARAGKQTLDLPAVFSNREFVVYARRPEK